MKSERKACAIAFLKAAVAYYASLGITVERVMTDNGSCYKAFAFRRACKRLGLRHIRTRPYTPRTNGKAERFIQTALREWAYARAYHTSRQRAAELSYWMHRYNWHRPHASIGSVPPITTLGLTGNNQTSMPSFSLSSMMRSKNSSQCLLRAMLSSVMKNCVMPCLWFSRMMFSRSSALRKRLLRPCTLMMVQNEHWNGQPRPRSKLDFLPSLRASAEAGRCGVGA